MPLQCGRPPGAPYDVVTIRAAPQNASSYSVALWHATVGFAAPSPTGEGERADTGSALTRCGRTKKRGVKKLCFFTPP